MPHWGRPPGAKGSKRRKRWEREREQAMYEERLVVELDSEDDSDTEGVGLASGKRFASDPLRFTGTDLATTRSRKNYTYQSGGSSESSSESEEEVMNAAQDALREKEEEALVQSALARIRRAQEKGRTEVKLNPEELDALEKRRKRMQAAATSKARKGSGSSGGSDPEKRRRTISVPIAAPVIAEQSRPHSRKRGMSRSRVHDEGPPQSLPNGGAPGMLVQGVDGVTYAPLGYYPPQAGSHRNSPTRPRSATLQQRMGPPPTFGPGGRYFSEGAPPAIGHGSNRHFSDGARPASSSSNGSRRPLPDEHDWVPTDSRRNSIAQSPVDPFEYQVESDVPPIPQQYMQGQGRRNNSGSGEVTYSSVRRSLPAGYSAADRVPSDPAVRRRSNRKDDRDELGNDSSDVEGDESNNEDLGNGVQVYVAPEPEKEKPVSRKQVAGKKRGKR